MSLLKKLFFCTCIFWASATMAQKNDGFEINGEIGGLEDGDTIRLVLYSGNGMKDGRQVDVTTIRNSHFQLRGHVPEGPRFYWLWLGHKSIILHMNNNESITIRHPRIDTIHASDITHFVNISGSLTSLAALMSIPLIKTYKYNITEMDRCIQKISDSIGFNGNLLEGFVKAKEIVNYNTYLIWSSPHSEQDLRPSRAIFAEDFYDYSKHSGLLLSLYASLSDPEKNSFYGKKVKEMLPLCVGRPFPLFTLPNIDGKLIALKDIIAKSKITVVHFWGSADYSNPAANAIIKKQHDDLRAMYKKYHDKGLGIIEISADDSSSLYSLKKILREQQFPWQNVSDLKGNLKGSGGIIYEVYKEGGHTIPNMTNFILDDKGKIITYDPLEPELQWYLWKAFGE